MKFVIDTNCLYYMSRVLPNGFKNWDKIESEIYKKDIYLSSWSLVELITKDNLPEIKKEKIYKFIVEKALRFIPFSGETNFNKIIPRNFTKLTYGEYKQQLNAEILSEKKKNESELLRLIFIAAAHTYYFALYYKLKNDNASNDALGALSFMCEKLFLGNFDYLSEQSSELIDFNYLGEKDSIIGDKIFITINTLLFIITIYHDAIIDGRPFDLFPDFKKKLSDEQIKLVKKPINSKKLRDVILNRLNGDKIISLSKIVKKDYFDNAINDTIKALEKDIPIGFLYFTFNLIKKVFFEGRKPLKNDLIDNALFELYPHYRIITFDKKMKAIIKEFDISLFEENQKLANM